MNKKQRRDFLKFMGLGSTYLGTSHLLSSCGHLPKISSPLISISPSFADKVILAKGLEYKKLIGWGDIINSSNEQFGFNNDYIAFIPQTSDRALLWVNHESPHPIFVSGYDGSSPRTREHVILEQKSVGGSILSIEKTGDTWSVQPNSSKNRRISALTTIPFAAGQKVAGQNAAVGTFANCAGGVTPWKTVLTCEENYYQYYGELEFNNGKTSKISASRYFAWDRFFNYPPEHYGWVVEVNPTTGAAKKLTALGRFSHESATVCKANSGQVVVYSGDDKDDECLYKFVSQTKDSIERGELYVADLAKGRWISLNIETQPKLKKLFKNQLEVLIHTRAAAHTLDATELDRPEDIEICPKTGHVYVSLTNNKSKGNFHGSILKIQEKNNDHGSKEFVHETFIAGGSDSGFSAPDNLAFDRKGNLWITTDISGRAVGKPPYTEFKNNGLFYIPLSGSDAGKVFQVASAPVDAEFTGPCFSADYRTLFLSVQHPGEQSKSLNQLTSHWPDGGNSIPKPTVIQIHGKTLNGLMT